MEYLAKNKNIVKIKIDLFPIGQQEGIGHVLSELKLENNEKLDIDFVLSKSNINRLDKLQHPKLTTKNQHPRLDLTNKNSYLFRGWNAENSPSLPIFQIDKNKDDSFKLCPAPTIIAYIFFIAEQTSTPIISLEYSAK